MKDLTERLIKTWLIFENVFTDSTYHVTIINFTKRLTLLFLCVSDLLLYTHFAALFPAIFHLTHNNFVLPISTLFWQVLHTRNEWIKSFFRALIVYGILVLFNYSTLTSLWLQIPTNNTHFSATFSQLHIFSYPQLRPFHDPFIKLPTNALWEKNDFVQPSIWRTWCWKLFWLLTNDVVIVFFFFDKRL